MPFIPDGPAYWARLAESAFPPATVTMVAMDVGSLKTGACQEMCRGSLGTYKCFKQQGSILTAVLARQAARRNRRTVQVTQRVAPRT
jgi:hypothetical protein